MEKLQFEFVMKAAEDPKSSIIAIESVTNAKDQTYIFAEKLQNIRLHEGIMKTQAYQKIKQTLTKRHERRRVWITMTTEMQKDYIDEDGNMIFKGHFLEETSLEQSNKSTTSDLTQETLSQILEQFKKTMHKTDNIKKITDKFVLEKFHIKLSNAKQWISTFNKECTRLDITDDAKKIEALRLFLDEQDWYSSMLMKYTINSEWSTWEKNFCETYATNGWSPVRYALTFKYRQGTLLEYALKKERLLLEINKTIDKPTLIDLIAAGLPNYIADRIDRNDLKETEDLFRNIRGLEHLVNRKNWEKKTAPIDKTTKGREQPCRICEKDNRGNRYHPEAMCWFKNKNSDKPRRDQVRNVNNYELETELNQIDPKN